MRYQLQHHDASIKRNRAKHRSATREDAPADASAVAVSTTSQANDTVMDMLIAIMKQLETLDNKIDETSNQLNSRLDEMADQLSETRSELKKSQADLASIKERLDRLEREK